jgi:hypothetical protein
MRKTPNLPLEDATQLDHLSIGARASRLPPLLFARTRAHA